MVDVFNTTEQEIQYALSLNCIGKRPGERVLVYDFWNERFLGVCDREVLLTIPPYASEITNMKWEKETLSGEADVVANAECKPVNQENGLAELTVIRPESGNVQWKLEF
ncbi:MAG: hypothetical protein PUD50_02625 [Eubacteriales bacterium]|nr:hypothetical protein [Eubacteriales bacterium]